MTKSRDDDALGWAGDDDPTLVSRGTSTPPALTPAAPADDDELPEGWAVTGSPGRYADNTDATVAPTAADAPAPAAAASAGLIGIGILAGIYLLYTIGWFIGVSRIENPYPTQPLNAFMFSLGTWLAIAAPAVWFASSYWLTRGHTRTRWIWLILGVVLLAPLPFIAGTGGL